MALRCLKRFSIHWYAARLSTTHKTFIFLVMIRAYLRQKFHNFEWLFVSVSVRIYLSVTLNWLIFLTETMKYKTKDSQFDKAIDFVSRYPLIIDETTKFLWNISVLSSDMTRKYGILDAYWGSYPPNFKKINDLLTEILPTKKHKPYLPSARIKRHNLSGIKSSRKLKSLIIK